MYYDAEPEPEFSCVRKTYLECYVDHDPLSDESIARSRRYLAFIKASTLIHENYVPSFKHGKIANKIKHFCDHTSRYWLGGRGKIPFLLTEPYLHDDFVSDGVKYFRLPEAISPYGGGPFSTEKGLKIPACSLLYVKDIHARYLDEVAERIIRAAEKLPRWNSVSKQERKAARRSK